MDAQEILTRFYKNMNKGSSNRGKQIHVSSLCYDCLRRSYYGMTHDNQFYNLKTLITFWLGRSAHMTPILKESEVPLEWNVEDGISVIGTCDDYQDGVLIEKKTCRKIPLRANDQHIKQAEYYAFMLDRTGKPVREAHIIYIDVATPEVAVKSIPLRPFADIEKEMRDKSTLLTTALKEGKPPVRHISWLCSYCNYANTCFGNDQRNVKEFTEK